MPAIKVSDLKIGQKFESDIKFKNGVVLFKATEKVSFKNIKALKAWGFTEVSVVGLQGVTKNKSGNNTELMSDLDLEHIFSKTNNDDPVIIELKRLAQNIKNS